MQCVILAGGLATRMRPLTETLPKALIPIAGVPFIDHQLDWLASHGVTDVVLSVGYRGEMLSRHVGDGGRWGLRVRVVDEGSHLRGTAGALRLADEQGALDERFLVTYGDSFLPIDFAAVWDRFLSCRRPALMTVFRNESKWDASNVIFEDGAVVLYDKQHQTKAASAFSHIDYGLSALERRLVRDEVPSGVASDLAVLFHKLSVRGDLAGLEVTQRFYEIGSPGGLEDFSRWLAARSLIVLDRDGVLNRTIPNLAEPRPDSPLSVEQAEIFPWVPAALRRLTEAGYGIAIASNQPAAAKGKTGRADLEDVHRAICAAAQRDGGIILSSHICFHRAEDGCRCRKPGTGLLHEAFERNPVYQPKASWMVGDRATDVLAGAAFGMKTAYLGDSGGTDSGDLARAQVRPSFCGADLRDFVDFVLGKPLGNNG